MHEQELYHYGILGMKWGIRRFQNEDGTRTAEGKRRERAARNSERDTDSMSDEELRSAINRLQDEQQYLRIMANRNKSGVPGAIRGAANTIKTAGGVVEIANAASGGQLKDAKDVVGDIGKLADNTGKLAEQLSKNQDDATVKNDLKGMSDAELRKRVARLLMEERYDNLKKSTEVSAGEHFVKNVLPTIATVTTTVGSIASLVLTIMKLKEKWFPAVKQMSFL